MPLNLTIVQKTGWDFYQEPSFLLVTPRRRNFFANFPTQPPDGFWYDYEEYEWMDVLKG